MGVRVTKSHSVSIMCTARMQTVGRRCSDGYKKFAEAMRSFGKRDVTGDHVGM
jgi:hypothetical protein